ncbi:aldehyde dehydrogenase family protein [Pseudomonas aeruginosa]|nr:aldehyde dehydrogenase family protein [Pseudomonas aeruginosa]
MTNQTGALRGLKIIDLSRVLGGPYCSQALADHGAEVIKLEPLGGDETRGWGPPFEGDTASYFKGVNRNKKGIAVDLATAEGIELLLRLLEDADVLLEVDDPDLDIVQQETFGPVLTLQVFEHEEEGVALANRSEYGLAAGVWTRDVARAFRVARKIRAGTVWINDWAKVYDEFEEGGYRQSGLGRLNGVAALDDFVEYKHISLTTGAA